MKMKKIILIFTIIISVLQLYAQGELDEQRRYQNQDESSFAFSFNSNGYNLNYRFGKTKDGYVKKLYSVDLGILKHPKEIKSSLNMGGLSTGRFVYGKENFVFNLKLSKGKIIELYTKNDKGGIAVSWFYNYGLDIAAIKPIYYRVDVIYKNTYTTEDQKFTEQKPQKERIRGRSSFLMGFDEISFSPGAFIRAGLSFEYSKRAKIIRAIETGMMLEGFALDVPIMADTENSKYFIVIYASFRFGKILGQK